MEDNTK